MNKYRLNQILEILLFPFIDTELGKNDPLLEQYSEYRKYMDCVNREKSQRDRIAQNYNLARKNTIEYMVRRNLGRAKSEDDIQMLLEFYYPMSEIDKSIKGMEKEQNRKIAPEENIYLYYLNILDKIARSLVTYRDGIAAIRYWQDSKEKRKQDPLFFEEETIFSKVEIWNLLRRFTAPDIYIVMAAVDNGYGMNVLYEQKEGIALADKLLVKSIQKGVAENHLHFNVGFDYETLWLQKMDLQFMENVRLDTWNEKMSVNLGLALFRCKAAQYLCAERRKSDFKSWLQENNHVYEMIFQVYSGNYSQSISAQKREEALRIYRQFKSERPIRKYDFLMDKVYRKYLEYKTSSEFIFLYQSYEYLVKHGKQDTYFARIFMQYLRQKNKIYYNMFEQHTLQGLKFFQKKFDLAKKTAKATTDKTNLMVEIFRSQAKIKSLRKLEIRVVPAVDIVDIDPVDYKAIRPYILSQLSKQIYQILFSYKKYILESTVGVKETWEILNLEKMGKLPDEAREYILSEIERKKISVPTLGIIFHFRKAEYLEDMSGYDCWRSVLQNKRRVSMYRLLRYYFMYDIAIALEEIRSAIPKMSEYIVGIDAASDENAAEPWTFSMVYKKMRSSKTMLPIRKDSINGFEHIQNIGYTYHVGEDFRHLVSGLRHIDEVLEEFGYKSGDRLGHALALGINIEQWVQNNEVAPIPRLEYLENLLWMWGINTCEEIELPIQLEVLEDRIISMAHEIYEKSDSITVKMLYNAYKLKFAANPMQIIEQVDQSEKKNSHLYCRYDNCDKDCYNAWNSERLFATNYCPVYEERYGKKEMIRVNELDIPLYHVLQEYLITKVERMGIYVETNPTSNLSIGEFENMQSHPIFFLNQIGNSPKHRVLVTINSDDPAVFNTNVENEFAYIYYAAEKQGFGKTEILEWIERIRQYGMEASFITKMKSVEQIYQEIDDILEALKNEKWR